MLPKWLVAARETKLSRARAFSRIVNIYSRPRILPHSLNKAAGFSFSKSLSIKQLLSSPSRSYSTATAMPTDNTSLLAIDSKIISPYASEKTNDDLATVTPLPLERPFPGMERAHSILRILQFLALLAVVSMEAFTPGCPGTHLVNVLLVRKQFSMTLCSSYSITRVNLIEVLRLLVFCWTGLCHCMPTSLQCDR